MLSSRVALGPRAARALRLFLIPEESWPPKELRWTRLGVKRAAAAPGFVEAVTDPDINALVCGTTRGRPGSAAHLVREALVKGIQALTTQQKSALLNDPVSLARLHQAVYGAARDAAAGAAPSAQQHSASL